ncbi:MAG: alkylphosphonate utilization protein [Myxococcales bacterium]|nr:alkylphosphonate utilization protein [Myxococcales bacterium]USN50153.1 MAG: alkylphosphonate utilization protein [Myxococcales bacterium]
MNKLPNCPSCGGEYSYEDRGMLVCPSCQHEWKASESKADDEENIVRDVNGNELKDGDTVSVIKSLKVKGSSSGVKIGTKVKNIRIIDSVDGHNIDCKIDGVGAMRLKSEFVKKA